MTTLNEQDFRRAMSHFATGVAVVTAKGSEGEQGATISALTSVSLDPLLLLICLHRGSSTYKAIAEAGRFGLSILNNIHKDVAMLFASRTADKFESDVVVRAEDGTAFIDGALVQMHCELVETFQGGTHALFMAKPTSITVRDEAPLLYFQGQLGIEA
ncbi:flavin reductase family protein [Gluconobacter cerinus]|uniref:flavin reductase family protein n=1 Tax=Gluconobacter cerinus TaxID=38307 RepID=UPI001B8C0446|nr:flavin reductase family protein [Gluconobacter cerinus]MBS1037981.1 flavin reductase [Gluconobacter cerinus]